MGGSAYELTYEGIYKLIYEICLFVFAVKDRFYVSNQAMTSRQNLWWRFGCQELSCNPRKVETGRLSLSVLWVDVACDGVEGDASQVDETS